MLTETINFMDFYISRSITIFGGGFLGSELACALGHRSRNGSELEVRFSIDIGAIIW